MVEFDDRLFFRGGTENSLDGSLLRGLWASDGGPGPPELVANLDVQELTPFGNYLLFIGREIGGASRLWVSDGTPEGTQPLLPDPYGAGGLTRADGQVFFSYGTDLWRTDGTPAGTRLVKELRHRVEHYLALQDRLIFGVSGEM